MIRLASGIPPEHSDLECSALLWAYHQSIPISNAQMGMGHSNGTFRFPRRAFDIPSEHSDYE